MEVPAEIVGGVAAVLGAAAYAIRKGVRRRSSPGEEVRATTLRLVPS